MYTGEIVQKNTNICTVRLLSMGYCKYISKSITPVNGPTVSKTLGLNQQKGTGYQTKSNKPNTKRTGNQNVVVLNSSPELGTKYKIRVPPKLPTNPPRLQPGNRHGRQSQGIPNLLQMRRTCYPTHLQNSCKPRTPISHMSLWQ